MISSGWVVSRPNALGALWFFIAFAALLGLRMWRNRRHR